MSSELMVYHVISNKRSELGSGHVSLFSLCMGKAEAHKGDEPVLPNALEEVERTPAPVSYFYDSKLHEIILFCMMKACS